jgi:hypothetical protein
VIFTLRDGARPLAARVADERRILVDSRTAMNYAIVAPVVRAMAADPRVEFAFMASEDPGRIAEIYRDAPTHAPRIGRLRAAASRWDVYLTSDFMWATLPRGTVRVQMFHGVAGKYGFDAPTESMRAWDRLFFVNARRLRNFIACRAIDENSASARLIGMPKVDCLVDGSLRRDEILTGFGLDPSRPTLLYGPTWSPASSLNRMGTALIAALARMPINVVVKLHDRSRDRREMYSGGVDWVATLAPLLNRPNATLATSADITPYLAAADVMVTDHSSAGFEYLLLDRPLVRIESPDLLRTAHVHPDYARLLADVSSSASGVEAAVDAVEKALADPAAGSVARREVAAELFHRPGTATARAAHALYEVMELPAHASLGASTEAAALTPA